MIMYHQVCITKIMSGMGRKEKFTLRELHGRTGPYGPESKSGKNLNM